MRCPSCSKFATYDTSAEPEIDFDDVTVTIPANAPEGTPEEIPVDKTTGEAQVTGTARIVLTAECCGDDLKEATFDIDEIVTVDKHAECTCEDWSESPSVEVSNSELTDRSESSTSKIAKRGPHKGQVVTKAIPYRYQKRFYGVSLEADIKCACDKTIGSLSFADEIQASSMDEMV